MIKFDKLLELDEDYFDGLREFHEEGLTEDEAVHVLGTWWYDRDGWDGAVGRDKVKELFPDIYVRWLECVVDGDHDT